MYYKRKVDDLINDNIKNNKAVIITGMRRVGKTTLLKNIFDNIPSNKIWFDFENPLDIKYFEDIDYNDIYQNIINRGDLDKKRKIYVFIDEVQFFPEISKIVKYLIDHYKVKFFLTGSASYYLKNLFPESLSGRKIIIEVFPLDFEEFLLFKKENVDKYKKIKKKKNVTRVDYEIYDKFYEEYVEWGGFPQTVLANKRKNKEEFLKDIFNSYFQKEVISFGDYRKNNKIRDLIILLSRRVGSRLDIVKIADELKITRATVYSYLSFLQATYFIFLVSPFSKSFDKEVSGNQKVYFCDNGILRTINNFNRGQFLENAVFNQLKLRGTLNYFQQKSGAEIDFILDKKQAYEVKNTGTETDLRRLKRSMKTAKIKNGQVVSKNYIKDIRGVIFSEFL